jgi:hypothetical protein
MEAAVEPEPEPENLAKVWPVIFSDKYKTPLVYVSIKKTTRWQIYNNARTDDEAAIRRQLV